jgi:exopolysaccharide biosynthesis protein
MKYYIEGITHVVEVAPMDLRISVQDMAANRISLPNFVTSGFQMVQAEKTCLPMFPTSREIIQKGKYLTYPVGILVSEGHIIQNRQPHGKPAGTLIVYKDGRVECRPVLNLLTETDYNDMWFAVSGCSIWPKIQMKEEGFVGTFSDIGRICARPVIGYRKKDDKIVIAVRNSSNIYRGQLTLKNLGCDFGITLDAGGSTILRVNGSYKFKTTRRLHNVITW